VGRRTGSKKISGTASPVSWSFWWTLNKERFLAVKVRSRKAAALSDNRDTFLGDRDIGEQVVGVNRKQVVGMILPTLMSALKDDDYDVRAGAVIALGKVADPLNMDALEAIRGRLLDADKRVRESACLGLGLHGAPHSLETLFHIAGDTEEGRALVGRHGGVLTRTRAFAAVGIGLVASRLDSDERSRAGQMLTELLRQPAPHADVLSAPALALQLFPSPGTDGPLLAWSISLRKAGMCLCADSPSWRWERSVVVRRWLRSPGCSAGPEERTWHGRRSRWGCMGSSTGMMPGTWGDSCCGRGLEHVRNPCGLRYRLPSDSPGMSPQALRCEPSSLGRGARSRRPGPARRWPFSAT